MHDMFDKNEVIPVLVSTNNSNLSCAIASPFLEGGGGGKREGVGGRGLTVMLGFSGIILKSWGGLILYF